MSDKPQLQHVSRATALVLSAARSSLIARGFKDAKSILERKVGSANEDVAQAHYDHGLICYASQDYAQAAASWRKAAEREHSKAQFFLGSLYKDGQGVPQDYTQAAIWYRKAAEQGDVLAEYTLGVAYNLGQGVPQDHAQAVVWHRKAAEQGNACGQYSLAVSYTLGQGVTQDYTEACFWFNVTLASDRLEAAGRGLREEATKYRDAVAAHLSRAELTRVQGRTWNWSEAHPAKTGPQ